MKNRLFTKTYGKLNYVKSFMILLFAFYAVSISGQCVNDINDPTFTNCTPRTVTLDDGQCATPLLPALAATDNCATPLDTFAFSTSPTTSSTGYGCNMGPVSFYQIFTPVNAVRYTPYTVTGVTIGINNVLLSSIVEVKVYKTTGGLNPAVWTLIGDGTAFTTVGSNTTLTIPVVASSVLPNETFAIEVIAGTNAVFGNIVGFNNVGQSSPTYFRASACGVNVLTNISTVLGAGYGMAARVQGTSGSVFITPGNVSTPAPDAEFTAGVYNLNYIATDAAGNSASCAFTFTVNAPVGTGTGLACNDLVQISVDTLCQAVVGADQILEGGPYTCYDSMDVIIYNTANKPIGDKVGPQHVGQTLKVTVFNQAGNSCWGLIKVEDKVGPVLHCDPVYTTCLSTLKPGSLQPNLITVKAGVKVNTPISSSNRTSQEFTVNVFGLGNANVTDVDAFVSIDHTDLSNLQVLVTDPRGITVKLFGGIGGACPTDNIMASFDDAAMLNINVAPCNATNPAITGNYKPTQLLNAFNNQPANGTWKFTIIDSVAVDGGDINELSLVFRHSGGTIPFPTYNPITFIELGPAYYSVIGIDPCGPVTMGYQDEEVDNDCSSQYAKVIKRTWSATDAYGNNAVPCDQYIYVYRNGLSTLRFPPNYDGIELNTLSCRLYGDVVPGPDVTGRPTGDFCSNVQVFPHEDTKIDVCENSYKILRKWKILEWCNSEVIEHTQIIKVLDDVGPELQCPKDKTISTDPLTCNKDYTPEVPTVIYDCSDKLKFDLSYFTLDPNIINGQLPADAIFISEGITNETINNLPTGINFIKWVVTDACGNKSECIHRVLVRDEVPPVAVCDQFTRVSLGAGRLTGVAALSFDDLSNDNCEIVRYRVRKMTDKCGINANLTFRDSITFCCEEIGSTIMVSMEVTDRSGNSNTCMVEVKVEDKLPPYITKCPADITLNCQEDFKNLAKTGEPVFVDNCQVVSVVYTDSGTPDQCGEGEIRRTWTVTDQAGLKGSCVQKITLYDDDPFFYDRSNPNNPKNDIKFPPDYDATTCNIDLSPENLPAPYGYPVILDDDCSLTSVTYKDQKFTFVDGSCEKILRTWTVIDWCTYTQDGREGVYTDLQIIKLSNLKDPEFEVCRDVTVDIFGDCKGNVTQSVVAKDDCTPLDQIKYTYKIDLFDDGIFEANLTGSASTFTRELPIGKHRVYWTATDLCGNIARCDYILTVRDGKKPTPYCLSSVTSVVMPSNGMLTIWAKDFDLGSFDNCTPKNKLKISLTSNVLDTFKVFKCSDIPDGISMSIPIEMWVTDEAGNKDYCTITLELQDNTGDVCEDDIGSRVVIGGRVKTELNKSMTNTKVSLFEGSKLVKELMSTSNGSFVIDNVLKDKDYFLVAEKNDDITNGLSTLDLVLIQRHILGVSKLNSPYKIMAADVNNDEKISAADLVALRKVILGMTLKFPNNQKSWRFINANKTPGTNIFPLEDKIPLNDLSNSTYNLDFLAMKIGDVNASIVLNTREEDAEPRSNNVLDLSYETMYIDGKTKVNVYSNNDTEIYGFQTSINAEITSMKSGIVDIYDDNFATNENSSVISWNNAKAKSIQANELLFSFEVNGNVENIDLSNIIKNEAYHSVHDVSDIQLSKRELSESYDFEVYQNEPNPFSNQTVIGFRIPSSSAVKLKIYDQSGKILYMTEKNFEKGQNQFTITSEELSVSGMLYYEISTDKSRSTRKMINIK